MTADGVRPRAVRALTELLAATAAATAGVELLGVDGLVRDGAPLLAAVLLTVYAVWRTRRTAVTPADAVPA